MASRQIPARVTAPEDGSVFLSVREAARLLGVSPRCVYNYIARGKLARTRRNKWVMLKEQDVLAFKRRVPLRQDWLPLGPRLYALTTIIVPVRSGCEARLGEKLVEFHDQGKHQITGTCAGAMSRSLRSPEWLTILLFWPADELPPEQQREQEIAALAADLAGVCDWERALSAEGQIIGCVG